MQLKTIICLSVLVSTSAWSFDSRSRLIKDSVVTNFKPDVVTGYYTYTPPEYDTQKTKSFPLLVYLHGAGEYSRVNKGPDYSQMIKAGPIREIYNNKWDKNLPLIVISPQTWMWQADWHGKSSFIDEAIEDAKKKYRIDATRVYITGISAGGGGTMMYAKDYPHKVAAVMPVAGWGAGAYCNFDKIAYWGFHNENDGTVNSTGTTATYSGLQSCPGRTAPTRKTIYPANGHDAWTKTYSNSATSENIYYWLLNFSINGGVTPPPPVEPVNNPPVMSLTSAVELEAGQSKEVTISIQDEKTSTVTVKMNPALSFVTLSKVSSNQWKAKISPNDNHVGNHNLKLVATDEKGASSNKSLSIKVTEIEDVVVIEDPVESDRSYYQLEIKSHYSKILSWYGTVWSSSKDVFQGGNKVMRVVFRTEDSSAVVSLHDMSGKSKNIQLMSFLKSSGEWKVAEVPFDSISGIDLTKLKFITLAVTGKNELRLDIAEVVFAGGSRPVEWLGNNHQGDFKLYDGASVVKVEDHSDPVPADPSDELNLATLANKNIKFNHNWSKVLFWYAREWTVAEKVIPAGTTELVVVLKNLNQAYPDHQISLSDDQGNSVNVKLNSFASSEKQGWVEYRVPASQLSALDLGKLKVIQIENKGMTNYNIVLGKISFEGKNSKVDWLSKEHQGPMTIYAGATVSP